MAAAVPGLGAGRGPDVTSGIVLIVGSNFTKVVPVSVSDTPTNTAPTNTAPTPTPTATPSPNAAPVSADSAANRCTY